MNRVKISKRPNVLYTVEKDKRDNFFVMQGKRVVSSHVRDETKAKEQAAELNKKNAG